MIVVGLDCEIKSGAELEISTNSMGELVVILEALTYRANKAPGPVAPVAPVGPVSPRGPCIPVGPVGPVTPAGPASPLAPAIP